MPLTPSFAPARLVAVGLSLPESRYSTEDARTTFFASVVERVRSLPGIELAATTRAVPFLNDYVSPLQVEGRPAGFSSSPSSNFYAVTPG